MLKNDKITRFPKPNFELTKAKKGAIIIKLSDETRQSGTVRLLAQHGRLVRKVEFDTIKTCILSFLFERKLSEKISKKFGKST